MTATTPNDQASPKSATRGGSKRLPWLRVPSRARARLTRTFALILALAAVASALATYGVLTGSPYFGTSPEILVLLINVDLVLFLLLGVFVARRVVAVWSARRRGLAGSGLHVRLVMLFGLLSATPAIIVALFSVLFFDLGIESWFSSRVRTALDSSTAVARAYLAEHQKNIRGDALAIAREMSNNASRAALNPEILDEILKFQAQQRGINEAIVFRPNGDILAKAGLTFTLQFEPLEQRKLDAAARGEVVLMISETDRKVRALIKLNNFIETFLYVGRLVDSRVLNHISQADAAVQTFLQIETVRDDLQISFALIFALVALLLLLAAVWVGLNVATQMSRPISMLITATEQVRAGDLSARVPDEAPDEFGLLSRAFNRMTSQLDGQRRELLEASSQIDERRRFTEAVLTGVSAGVIGLDADGQINLPNRSASRLLGVDLEELLGHSLSDVVPEMQPLLNQARIARLEKPIESQIQLRRDTDQVTLLVRVATEIADGKVGGFVVTFDDITQLLTAQRKAAWADVARRIAHEIKNPLTPIQLSAERLKRKYLKEVQSDPSVFETCTDTIIRQVGDIGRMVDEFSSFARMPEPVVRPENLTDLCRQAVFLQRNANSTIDYELDLPEGAVRVACDGRQISQAVTNLLQNAADAIDGRTGPDLPKGCITLRLMCEKDDAVIAVADNGKGLPDEGRERLTEPYVTTRTKGTGLGLAIVRKIMEDHGGRLVLEDGPSGGAVVTLRFPAVTVDEGASTEDTARGAAGNVA